MMTNDELAKLVGQIRSTFMKQGFTEDEAGIMATELMRMSSAIRNSFISWVVKEQVVLMTKSGLHINNNDEELRSFVIISALESYSALIRTPKTKMEFAVALAMIADKIIKEVEANESNIRGKVQSTTKPKSVPNKNR